MSDARELLKLTQAILHGYACQQEDDCLEACQMARAFLAQPMTACEAREAAYVTALKGVLIHCLDKWYHTKECIVVADLGAAPENCNCKRGQAQSRARKVLADISPAAAALLAQGERVESLEKELREAHEHIALMAGWDPNDWRKAITALGEEKG